MPDIQALIRYINQCQIKDDWKCGYTFSRDIPPAIQDTFFAMSCLKMLKADSPDGEIVSFLSEWRNFDLNDAYYAMKCLRLAGANVTFQEGMLLWVYSGDEQARPCTIPGTPLLRYFNYGMYRRHDSSIFSSSLGTVLKRIELGADRISNSLVHATFAFLNMDRCLDIVSVYMALEILKAMKRRGYPVELSSYYIEQISAFLKRCTARKGYVANPTVSLPTLDSTYAGHKIAQYLKIPDPLGIPAFINSLQNQNGGFRMLPSGGIPTLESCYLAMSILTDLYCEE
ncbi:MAG: hypothetical protein ACE14P_03815 [Methanotrichaceae archaeon]